MTVPEDIRETGATFASGHERRRSNDSARSSVKEGKSATWIIEIASQILFSNSAAVHYEVLVGRDERSLELGFAAVAGHGHGAPGQVQDHQRDRKRDNAPAKGVYSRAVKLVVEDTRALWDKPKLPTGDENPSGIKSGQGRDQRNSTRIHDQADTEKKTPKPKGKKKKVHLVVLTHGLHSNLSADMLYLKESIDATVRQAREDARKRKASYRNSKEEGITDDKISNGTKEQSDTSTAPLSGGQEDIERDSEADDEEETIVRGFTGNAVRTEKGIQYLGKRLARYVLHFTYPDQPFLPVKKSVSRTLTDKFTPGDNKKVTEDGLPSAHNGSSIHRDDRKSDELPYTFTSISFIGHSLGGLIQTYAIAYIQKHAPQFFQQIQPINFICMASPLLGLSNENPMYVKFALDFGLVGRTGQDLGLTWRAPNIAKTGWGAMGTVFGSHKEDERHEDPGAKPLLRILPTGPAHYVLCLFRNRTVYSNVVNDGIVPLRTSCLLFLDWRGLGKVEKARRENGLIGTALHTGWAELTGAHAYTSSGERIEKDSSDAISNSTGQDENEVVPQPAVGTTEDDNKNSNSVDPAAEQFLNKRSSLSSSIKSRRRSSATSQTTGQSGGLLDDIFNFFKPGSTGAKPKKLPRAIRRGQTIKLGIGEADEGNDQGSNRGNTDKPTMRPGKRPVASRGDSIEHPASDVQAPPKTSVFEAASDILHPPIPSTSWIIDPSSRSKTIFHDRVYHPEDIPPPPVRRPTHMGRSFSSDSAASIRSRESNLMVDTASMKVEEKIARAYHKDLSWRKVLVSLEPDAHNNMIVRRMFANAYGWPVVKHLCDTHFADTWSAKTRDENEPAIDRAKGVEDVPPTGEQVQGQSAKQPPRRKSSDMRENRDELGGLDKSVENIAKLDTRHKLARENSMLWDDSYFEGSDDEDEDDAGFVQRFLSGPKAGHKHHNHRNVSQPHSSPSGPSDGHRGLRPTSPTVSKGRADAEDGSPVPPVLTDKLTGEPDEIAAPSVGDNSSVEMGLRKSIEEQMSPPRKKKQAHEDETDPRGVAEQVAEASLQSP